MTHTSFRPGLTDESEVWSGSLWHADCDPFLTVVVSRAGVNYNFPGETCEAILARAAAEEEQSVLDSDCDEDCEADCEEHAADIRTSGAFPFALSELGLTDDQVRDLEINGYTYI